MKPLARVFLLALILLVTPISVLFAQWVQTNGPSIEAACLAANGSYLFAGTYGQHIFLSADDGDSWTLSDSGLTCNGVVHAITFSGQNVIACGSGRPYGGIYLSADNGISWSEVFDSSFPLSLVSSDNNVFAGVEYIGVLLSSDNGITWNPVNNGLTNSTIVAFAVSGTNILAGSEGGGVFLTTDNGTNWTAVNNGLSNLFIFALAVSGTHLFAGTEDGIFVTTDNGTNWSSVNTGLPTGSRITDFAVIDTNIFVSIVYDSSYSYSSTVYLSTNYGGTWNDVGSGLPMFSDWISTLTIKDNNIFAGDYWNVWRRPLSEMITGIEEIPMKLPKNFILHQNYPNPFNPITNIEFSIPKSEFVSLKIYNILGEEVVTLVSEKLAAGSYKYDWDASSMTSGVYLYRIQAGNYNEVKKMILMK